LGAISTVDLLMNARSTNSGQSEAKRLIDPPISGAIVACMAPTEGPLVGSVDHDGSFRQTAPGVESDLRRCHAEWMRVGALRISSPANTTLAIDLLSLRN